MNTRFWYKHILLAIGLIVIVLLLMKRREAEPHNGPQTSAEDQVFRNIIERQVEATEKVRREKRAAYAALLGTIEREDSLSSEIAHEVIKLCQQYLAASLHDEDIESRIAAIEALGEVGNKSHVTKVFTAEGVNELRVRSASIRAMAKLKGKDVSVYLVGIISTGGASEDILPIVAWAYGEAGDKEHLSIFKGALKERNANTRIRIAEAIYKMGDHSGIPVVKADLADENVPPESRIMAAEVLYNIGDKAGLPFIERALKHEKDEVRREASATLARIGEASTIPALKSALTDRDVYVRINAAEALSRLNDKPCRQVFDDAVKSEDWKIRRAAAIAINELVELGVQGGELESRVVIPLMKSLSDDDHEQVRAAAVQALGALRNDSLMPLFREALKDDKDIVRVRGAEGLAKIAIGKSAGLPATEPSEPVIDVKRTRGEEVNE